MFDDAGSGERRQSSSETPLHHSPPPFPNASRLPHRSFPTEGEPTTLFTMRVLVVEDDVKIASFVVRGLKQAAYAVDHAPDGETGLALAESTDYDAAIVDVMLPKLDGISLVKRLRAARRPIPVLC